MEDGRLTDGRWEIEKDHVEGERLADGLIMGN